MSHSPSEKHKCVTCHKALGGCSWPDRFEPVDGWVAKKVSRAHLAGEYSYEIVSYDISYCPEFEPDKPISPEILDKDGCMNLLGAIFNGIAQDYVSALENFDFVTSKANPTLTAIETATRRVKTLESLLTPEISSRLKAKYYREKRKTS